MFKVFLFARRRRVEFAFLGGLVLGCFFVLGLVAFVGCVWKNHRTSQNVIESQKSQGGHVSKNFTPSEESATFEDFSPFEVIEVDDLM